MRVSKRQIICSLLGGCLALTLITPALAANIETIEVDLKAKDFLVGPVKTEVTVDPGQKVIKSLTITNRFERDRDFKLEIEDFSGTKDMSELVHFWGANKGPYSLREFIFPELTKFTLKSGERVTMPVVIDIPAGIEPGGLFGAVIVTSEPTPADKANADLQTEGQVALISRVASLFFVRVSGDAKEDGFLREYSMNGRLFTQPKLGFRTVFENNGSTSLNPAGKIEVKNLLGSSVGNIAIEPYFVLPTAARALDYTFERPFMFGYYTATIFLNRGYDGQVDTKTLSFWVLPYKIIGLAILILLVFILLVQGVRKWFKSNFQRKA